MITAQVVKELREKTGAGMMDCKKALSEANGDMDKAAGIIRNKGIAVAVKKAHRITSEGIVAVYVSEDNKSAGIIEVNCETDFVAANSKFTTIAKNLAKQAALTDATSIEQFTLEKYIVDGSTTVKDTMTALIARLGENMSIKRFEKLNAVSGVIQGYTHAGGRIGVVAQLACTQDSPVLLEIAKEAAMQIAATNPLFIDKTAVDEEILNKKRDSYKTEAISEGKPEKIIEKIVAGKIQKYIKEVCLLEQAWVKNPDLTIAKYLQEKSEELGAPVSIVRYIRFEKGDGIEK